jgi:hypothetical protein
VQRWEEVFGMPIRRPDGAHSKKATVLIHRKDLDVWLAERLVRSRATLKESIQLSRELRDANRKLSGELSHSIQFYSKECSRLATRSLERPWSASAFTPSIEPCPSLPLSCRDPLRSRYLAETLTVRQPRI